jgi:hypothetical protein
MGITTEMFVYLAAHHGEKTAMIDVTYFKTHRTASSLAAQKGDVAA